MDRHDYKPRFLWFENETQGDGEWDCTLKASEYFMHILKDGGGTYIEEWNDMQIGGIMSIDQDIPVVVDEIPPNDAPPIYIIQSSFPLLPHPIACLNAAFH